ncbi:MAG TPA: DUF349 domain-containing protein [Bacteroidales bacterium]|nr:DUF349 domain-containing protein [Bacteroidales bacterium]HPS27218.1 DUF349 domain-containing protein [Bacteroidales bacterium]
MDELNEKNPSEEIGNTEENNSVADNSPANSGNTEISNPPEDVARQEITQEINPEELAKTATPDAENTETTSDGLLEATEETTNPPVEAKTKKQASKRSSTKKNNENDDLLSEKDFSEENEGEEENQAEEIATYSSLSKEKLVELLEEIVRDHEISKIKVRVAGIKVAYINLAKKEKQEHLNKHLAEGGSKEDYLPPADALEERYKAAFDRYKEKKAKDDVEQEKIKLSNLELKKQILEEIKQLISSEESLKKTYDAFKNLQDKWKGIGQVPRNEIDGLWNSYHFLVEKFFEKVKINKELKDLDLKKNLEQKIQLCEKSEELLLEKSITKSFKLLQKYHDEWKEIGPVMLDKKDEIWERFKTVSDQINNQRKEYYNKLNAEQETNLLAKTALCEKAEAIIAEEITNSNEWKTKTEEILEMQELWDSIGRAPAKNNDEIWDRFRSAINTFYNNKKEFFGDLKEQQVTNYNKKIDICNQAEALVNNTNWKQSTAEILKLQQEWKHIGPVPKRYSDKIWKRFRTACDAYFEKKSGYFSNIQENEKENLKKKDELIEKINSFELSENKNENLDALKNFQRQWMEIGHVPMDSKEKLQNTYRLAIKQLMEKLKISAVEMNTMNYKNRIENLQNSPEAGRALSHERMQLEGRINMLKNDIKLWENNIGFLANSKKANLLKEEFENKINNTKQELALLEAKLKMLFNAKK